MANLIQLRRGTRKDWSDINPILASGEIGIETDYKYFKIGNGTDHWNNLDYTRATIIQDENNRLVTDVQIAVWNDKYTKSQIDAFISSKASIDVVTPLANGLMVSSDKSKLDSIETGANKYVHPDTHPASMIEQDSAHRFVSDIQITTWTDTYTKEETDSRFQSLVNAAPAALDTLGEIALQLSSDESAVSALTTSVSLKANLTDVYTKTQADTLLSLKASSVHGHIATDITQDSSNRMVSDTQISTWDDKATKDTATIIANGLMSLSDKSKLDGIASGAEVNVNTDWSSTSGDSQLLNKPDGETLVPGFTNKYLSFPNITDPGAANTGTIRVYSNSVCGRSMLKWVGQTGLDNVAQPMVAFNKVAWWNPPGNATTVPGVNGMSAYTVVGNPTIRSVSTTNMFTRMKRLGFISGSATASLTGVRQPYAQFTIGTGTGLGGFTKVIRFGISDTATVSTARMFVGMSSSTSAPTNVEPSTLTNSIGVGHGASDSNLKLFYGGSTAQTAIDLGSNFPKNTLSTDVYELMLFSPPSVANTVYYRVTRLNTGNVAEGTLTATTAGTQLPSSTTLLNMTWCYRTNNTTALAVGLDIMSDYIETDY